MSGPAVPADTTRVGTLLGPHGVQGAIKLYVLGDPAQVRRLKRLYVQGRGWLSLTRTEPLAPGLVLHFGGLSSREGAEALRGLEVYAADAELPPLEPGSYYYHDLRGLPVHDAAGTLLGEVSDVLDMGHQDVLEVATLDGGEALLPLQAPYVQIRQQGRRLLAVDLTEDTPEGLFGTDHADEADDTDGAGPGARP